jgi:two-component system chemotaxis response regulator CheY
MANILIADDSPVFRSALKKVLEDAGHTILAQAANADEAMRLLDVERPDLLMLDLLMPGKTGLDVLREIGKKHDGLKVLVVTAVNQKAVNDQAKKLGATSVIYKPFDSDELVAIVSKILGRTDN